MIEESTKKNNVRNINRENIMKNVDRTTSLRQQQNSSAIFHK